jgi:hypothetical protein
MMRLFLVLVLGLLTAASVAAQKTPECPNLQSGTGQPGWMLVSGPGVTVPRVPVNVAPYSGWAGPIAGSSWVSVDANRGNTAGDYTYEYTFCVCREKGAALNLSFYADNGAKVYLNGTQIYATAGPLNFKVPVKVVPTQTALFPGTNTLRIVVWNESIVTGLDALLKVTNARGGCCGRQPGAESEKDSALSN